MLYSGIPKKRRKAVPGGNKVACGVCGIPGLSLDMLWQTANVPGPNPATRRVLVHPECKDAPRSSPHIPRLERPPYVQQPCSFSEVATDTDIVASAAVFVATNTTTATRAQLLADPTIEMVGTGFTTKTYGRTRHTSSGPLLRVTTYTLSTLIYFELEPVDINAGSLVVGAARIDYHGTRVSDGLTLTVT